MPGLDDLNFTDEPLNVCKCGIRLMQKNGEWKHWCDTRVVQFVSHTPKPLFGEDDKFE